MRATSRPLIPSEAFFLWQQVPHGAYLRTVEHSEVEMYVLGIARRSKTRAPMEELKRVLITIEDGVEGDFRGKGGKDRRRQITVLNQSQWIAACEAAGTYLPWRVRRANLFVSGEAFHPGLVGKFLRFQGSTAVLEVTGETDPCKRMNEVHDGLMQALVPDWRGGITCRVIRAGELAIDTRAHFE